MILGENAHFVIQAIARKTKSVNAILIEYIVENLILIYTRAQELSNHLVELGIIGVVCKIAGVSHESGIDCHRCFIGQLCTGDGHLIEHLKHEEASSRSRRIGDNEVGHLLVRRCVVVDHNLWASKRGERVSECIHSFRLTKIEAENQICSRCNCLYFSFLHSANEHLVGSWHPSEKWREGRGHHYLHFFDSLYIPVEPMLQTERRAHRVAIGSHMRENQDMFLALKEGG